MMRSLYKSLFSTTILSGCLIVCGVVEARAQSASTQPMTLPQVTVVPSPQVARPKPRARQSAASGSRSTARACIPRDRPVDLPTISVEGPSSGPEGPGEGIVAHSTRTATKTNTLLIDAPQSISVVTREQMDRQNVHSINEALRYTPGVATEQWGGVTAYDQLTIRGFNYGDTGVSDTFLDGLRLNNGLLYAIPQFDPFLVERVEVLRGPASVLYGLANPGGIVALSSKLPVDREIRLIELEGGNRRYGRASLDVGGRLNPEGTLLYRFAATAYTRDGLSSGTTTDRFALAPSMTWRPSAQTSLTLNATYTKDPHVGSIQSLPAVGTVFPNPHGWLPINAFSGEPNYNTFRRETATIGYKFDHAFNDSWSISSRGRYMDVASSFAQVMLAGLQPDNRTINRGTAVSQEQFRTFDTDTSLNGRFDTGPIRHDMLVGLGTEYFRGRADYGQGYASPLDIYNPVYGIATITPPFMYMDNGVRSDKLGTYLQDTMSLGRWRVTLGLRHDWSNISTTDHLWGGSFKQHDQATTFRGGALYRFDNGIAPYFTYAQSFQPMNQLSATGEPFKPTRGELYEAGIKYQPAVWPGMLSAAVFNLTQDNTLTADPNNPVLSIQAGQIRSRGIELEARLKLTEQFSFIGAYTWQDVRYTRDNSGLVGKTPLRVPNHIASAWLSWDAPQGTFFGLGAGVGIRYNGGTYGGTMAQQFQTASFTLVDAMLSYDFGKQNAAMEGVRLQLNAQNLLNERYVAGCYSISVGCFYGAGRTVTAKLSYRF
jgi:iron complex outermembrane receptor protein